MSQCTPPKSFGKAPVSTWSSACHGRYGTQQQEQTSNTTVLRFFSFFLFWSCWIAPRWPWKQRWQDYHLQALKSIPISNCTGNNKGWIFWNESGTRTVQRKKLGHCTEIKDAAWIEVWGRRRGLLTSKKDIWVRNCTMSYRSWELIACLREVLLWNGVLSKIQ